MARKQRIAKSVVLNRSVLDALLLGYADGFQEVGDRIIDRAEQQAPDQPPLGKGLVGSGRAVTFWRGKRVGGVGSPPRGSVLRQGLTTIVGFGFPGRFNEEGTQHQPARPFLTPAIVAEVPGAAAVIAPAAQRRVDAVRG